MELVDMPKEKDELTKAQSDNLFESIVRGKDVIEEIETSKGKFKVKFPRMKDIETIGRLAAYRLNGMSAQSFDPNIYALMQEIATLDVVVISGPAWFENSKKDVDNFTWGMIPTQEFIQEVYGKAFEFRLKVQKMLERKPDETDSGMVTGKNTNDADQPGLFEGLSGKSGASR